MPVTPICKLCGGPMKKTVVSNGNCAGITIALVVFFVGLAIIFMFPVIGWILGPVIMIGALFMGGKRRKVWKCTQCGAINDRA